MKIQMVAAYEKLGKSGEARSLLKLALKDALSDELVMPFVENYQYLSELLEGRYPDEWFAFLSKIIELGRDYEEQRIKRMLERKRPECMNMLTEREIEIAELMAIRLSNKEIAAKLFLSEGTIKQYVNQIYAKLHIDGDTRTKRARLLERMEETKNQN